MSFNINTAIQLLSNSYTAESKEANFVVYRRNNDQVKEDHKIPSMHEIWVEREETIEEEELEIGKPDPEEGRKAEEALYEVSEEIKYGDDEVVEDFKPKVEEEVVTVILKLQWRRKYTTN